MSPAAEPRAFWTDDLEHARAETARLYYPLHIEPVGASGSFGLDMVTVRLGPLTLGRLAYASDIWKDCGDLRTAYHVNVPLTGRVASTCGDQPVMATPQVAAVFNPSGRTILDRWTPVAPSSASRSTGTCWKPSSPSGWTGRCAKPLKFQMPMDTAAPGNQSWLHALQMLPVSSTIPAASPPSRCSPRRSST